MLGFVQCSAVQCSAVQSKVVKGYLLSTVSAVKDSAQLGLHEV